MKLDAYSFKLHLERVDNWHTLMLVTTLIDLSILDCTTEIWFAICLSRLSIFPTYSYVTDETWLNMHEASYLVNVDLSWSFNSTVPQSQVFFWRSFRLCQSNKNFCWHGSTAHDKKPVFVIINQDFPIKFVEIVTDLKNS